MQFGHIPLALSIATFDWSPRTVVLCAVMHFLPNSDSLLERSGVVPPKFHSTVTHSILFAVVVSGLVWLFSPHYAVFTLAAIITHYAADIGATGGLPLLWPFCTRKFTLSLFKATGYWGKEMYVGYYRQPITWVIEGATVAFFVYRLFKISVLHI